MTIIQTNREAYHNNRTKELKRDLLFVLHILFNGRSIDFLVLDVLIRLLFSKGFYEITCLLSSLSRGSDTSQVLLQDVLLRLLSLLTSLLLRLLNLLINTLLCHYLLGSGILTLPLTTIIVKTTNQLRFSVLYVGNLVQVAEAARTSFMNRGVDLPQLQSGRVITKSSHTSRLVSRDIATGGLLGRRDLSLLGLSVVLILIFLTLTHMRSSATLSRL
mgnify:CR=1 FL=1